MEGYKSFSSFSNYLYVLVDTKLQILNCNTPFFETFSIDCETLVGKTLAHLTGFIEIRKCKEIIKKCLINHTTTIRIETQNPEAAGKKKISYLWEVTVIKNNNIPSICFLGLPAPPAGKNGSFYLATNSNLYKIATSPVIVNNQFLVKSGNTELSLKKREQQFRSLSENIPGAIYEFIFRKDGTMGFNYLSPSIERIFNIPLEVFMRSLDFIHPDDLERLMIANNYSQQTSKPFYFEGRLVTAAGKIKWHSASSSYSYSTADGSRIFTGIFLDITDRKLADEEILKNESRFRLILEKIGDNAWEHDFIKNEIIFSKKVYDLLGHTAANLRSNIEIWWNSIHPDDKWMIEENDKKYKAGELESHSLEYRIYHANGDLKWVLDRGVVTERNEEGLPARIVGLHTDITKEKRLHERLLALEREKKKDLLQAVIEAQEKEREEISYELHENINQVLSVCKLKLGTALKGNKADAALLNEIKANIDQVIEETRNISQGLSISTLQLIGLPQAVNDLISRINKIYWIKIKIKIKGRKLAEKIDLKISITLLRVIQEQIRNILKHSGASKVDILLEFTINEISVVITDDGKGFDKSTEKKGLGLTNIINRVENYNGTISLNTKIGKGCSLIATIPIGGNDTVDRHHK